jgi:hypothetical protein
LLLGLAMFFANRNLGLRPFVPAIAGAAAVLALLTWVAQAWIYT